MIGKGIMNWILYGNSQGTPVTNKGKSSDEYNEFISNVFSKKDDDLPEVSYNCQICEDTGIVTKTEWSGDDDSYEVEAHCKCQED